MGICRMLRYRKDLMDSDEIGLLCYACRNGNLGLTQMLLADGRSDPAQMESMPLVYTLLILGSCCQ